MATHRRAAVLWSGGKDSALALDRLLADGWTVTALVNNVDAALGRDRAHGVPDFVIRAQGAALGIPLRQSRSDWAGFRAAVEADLTALEEEGVEAVAFGDISLDEHREWNAALARRLGLQPLFPLWGEAHSHVVEELVSRGWRAFVTAVKPPLDASWLGKWLDDEGFIRDLQRRNASPAGERGEYHTLVVDGALFRRRLGVVAFEPRKGEHGYGWLDVGLPPC